MAIRGTLNSAPTFATFFSLSVSARTRARELFPVAGIIALVALLPTILQAATFTVTKTADTADGVCDADCSLREAIIAANALTGADTIAVPAGVYTLTIAGRGEDAGATGDFDITDALAINGADARTTIIDGGGLDRLFDLTGSVITSLSDLTIRNGNPGIDKAGGISNRSTTLTISDVMLTGNTADGNGGGLDAGGASTTTITNSTISDNSSTSNRGGGVFSQGTLSLTNVTVSGNAARFGGGLNCAASCTATNVTVTANSASTDGDGIRTQDAGSISLKNSIVADNAAGQECSGTVVSLGNNLSSDGTCSLTGPGDKPNTSPLLGPLQDNGGSTDTHELLAGSPAIDAGTNVGCPATDQRGVARPIDGDGDTVAVCDIGAYEAPILNVAILSLMKNVTTLEDPFNGTTNPKAIPGATMLYTIRLTNFGSGPADADSVVISDSIPANTALRVIDFDGSNAGPVAFVDGTPTSGLTYTFVALGDPGDDIEFSNDGGSTYTYTPAADADGVDTTVTHMRINPKGTFLSSTSGDPNFEVLFKNIVQ